MRNLHSTFEHVTGASVLRPVQEFGRAAPRHSTVLLSARLRTEASDYLCRVRNISANGMMLEAAGWVEPGMTVEVELRNAQTVAGSVVWTGDGKAGLSIKEGLDVQTVLALPAPQRRSQPQSRRHPRFEARCGVELGHVAGFRDGTLLNISQHGCKVRAPAPLQLAEQLTVGVPGLPAEPARVCWVQGREAGLVFYEALPFGELSTWLGDPALRYAATGQWAR